MHYYHIKILHLPWVYEMIILCHNIINSFSINTKTCNDNIIIMAGVKTHFYNFSNAKLA